MEFIAMAMRDEMEKVATLSFPCIMCGACATKCPAEISQPNVALLARRIYGRHVLPIPESVYHRIYEIKKGRYDKVLESLTQMDLRELMEVYTMREQEPQENHEWIPKNPSFPEDYCSIQARGKEI